VAAGGQVQGAAHPSTSQQDGPPSGRPTIFPLPRHAEGPPGAPTPVPIPDPGRPVRRQVPGAWFNLIEAGRLYLSDSEDLGQTYETIDIPARRQGRQAAE